MEPIAPALEGRLVRLRAVEEADLAAINEGIWNPSVTQHLMVSWPEGVESTRAFWEGMRASNRDLFLAIETLEGELVGACALHGISSRSRTAALGIWLAEPRWGLGYGTDAVRTLCRFGFREMNLQRIDLDVFETNPRAVHSYEKVGFREEGRRRRAHFLDGRYVDMLGMGLLAEELIED